VWLQVFKAPQVTLPTHLPSLPGPLKQKFDLPDKLRFGLLIQSQLSALGRWLMLSHNFTRKGPGLSQATWKETYLPKILVFFGVAWWYGGHREKLCLEMFGDQHMWLLYISYLTAKGLHRPAVGQHLNASIAVVKYLQQQHPGHDIQQHLQHTLELMGRAKENLLPGLPLHKPVPVQQVQQEVNAEEVVVQLFRAIQSLLQQAWLLILREGASWAGPTAMTVADALLLAFLFYSIPSPRESMLIQLQQPGIKGKQHQGPCCSPALNYDSSTLPGQPMVWTGVVGSSSNACM
jgi:hypothetical protein